MSDRAIKWRTHTILSIYMRGIYAWLEDEGLPFRNAAAMAKLHSSEAAVDAMRLVVQVFGGADSTFGFWAAVLLIERCEKIRIRETQPAVISEPHLFAEPIFVVRVFVGTCQLTAHRLAPEANRIKLVLASNTE